LWLSIFRRCEKNRLADLEAAILSVVGAALTTALLDQVVHHAANRLAAGR
jgi:hypothetical protein